MNKMFKKLAFYLFCIRDFYQFQKELRKPKHLQDKYKMNTLICGSRQKYEEFRSKGYID